MALVLLGKTTCAISGRIITGEERVICFPPFRTASDEPETICSDACVLRDEFEKWEFRDRVIELVKKFWVRQYLTSEAFTVVYRDNEYLLVKGGIEAKMRILFLKYVFVIDIPQAMWQDFYRQLLNMQGSVNFSPYSTFALSFNETVNKLEIRLDIQGNGWDCIELSLSEWSRFQSMLAVSKGF